MSTFFYYKNKRLLLPINDDLWHVSDVLTPIIQKEFNEIFQRSTHLNKLDGHTFEYIDDQDNKTITFYIDGKYIEESKYWNHPEVKKYMLLKALKELK
jgi:hypothetical protein